jgi:hypothetical protein
MTIDQARDYLKRRYKNEYHKYIDTKLAGDFAVAIAEKQYKMELKQETRRG